MKQYKSLNFDLDTKALKIKYPGNSYENAYYDIRMFLKNNGFEHRQGSGYVSVNKMEPPEIEELLERMLKVFPWLEGCVNRFDVSNVVYTNQFDLSYIFDDKTKEEIPEKATKEDIKKATDKEHDDTYIKPETEKPVRRRHR